MSGHHRSIDDDGSDSLSLLEEMPPRFGPFWVVFSSGRVFLYESLGILGPDAFMARPSDPRAKRQLVYNVFIYTRWPDFSKKKCWGILDRKNPQIGVPVELVSYWKHSDENSRYTKELKEWEKKNG